MTNVEIIEYAIRQRRSVTGFYNGHTRRMSPHVLGEKKGVDQALFYQYGGTSSSGLSDDSTQNWRCIPVNKIRNLEINEDEFETENNHSKNQTCVDDIRVEIEY